MLVVLISWCVLSLVVGVLIGKAIHRADVAELTPTDAEPLVLHGGVPLDEEVLFGGQQPGDETAGNGRLAA